MQRRHFLLAAAATLAGGLRTAARAEDTSRWTAIFVTDMHCADCARKIAEKIYALGGVRQVKANLKRDLAYVIPEEQAGPRAGAIWRAVEAAGFQPVKLVGPEGEFTARPDA